MDTTIDMALQRSRVIPVASIPDALHAEAIGEALLEGGISIIEVTLRTRDAFAAIRALRQSCPDLLVGAGTVWTPQDWVMAEEAGAQFIVSPGAPVPLVDSGLHRRIPYLPGAQTPTEVAALAHAGYEAVKFFPAATAGGVDALRALAAVFPAMRFCPTGGITVDNARQYLALSCVPCVGGSWLLSRDLLEQRDWARVRSLARDAHDQL
jgi:2-dehydro-3-deoxyphosphogluconate aldolase/(4S)-4-hydroxy-2-oxoglutarate aldolase